MNEKQVVLVKNSDVKEIDFRKLNNRGEKFLTESGVYKLIFKSKKESAEIYDTFVDKEATFSFRELRRELESALEISIKETELKEVMREMKWIGKNVKALAYATRNGYMVTKDVLDKYGNPRTQDRFTMEAREELLDYFVVKYFVNK